MNKDFSQVIVTLEEECIVTVEDLSTLTDQQMKELAIPLGLRNRLLQHMKERTARKLVNNPEAEHGEQHGMRVITPHERLFILIGNDDYSSIRSFEKLKTFIDLPTAREDVQNVKQGLLSLGV